MCEIYKKRNVWMKGIHNLIIGKRLWLHAQTLVWWFGSCLRYPQVMILFFYYFFFILVLNVAVKVSVNEELALIFVCCNVLINRYIRIMQCWSAVLIH